MVGFLSLTVRSSRSQYRDFVKASLRSFLSCSDVSFDATHEYTPTYLRHFRLKGHRDNLTAIMKQEPIESVKEGGCESPEPIAVIGLSFRFPQDVTSPDAFWDILKEGRSTKTPIPLARMNANAFYQSNGHGSDHVRLNCTLYSNFFGSNPAISDSNSRWSLSPG